MLDKITINRTILVLSSISRQGYVKAVAQVIFNNTNINNTKNNTSNSNSNSKNNNNTNNNSNNSIVVKYVTFLLST